jgi:8-oxo-dGTP pyrophosphatase MutT (NUDIX family)
MGGVLPTCIYKNKLYFLLGNETNRSGWKDFGGRSEKNESPKQTAFREGMEELCGFLDLSKVKHTLAIKSEHYRSYLFKLDYDESLPFYFNNNHRFLEKYFDTNQPVFEKKEIRWVCMDELLTLKLHSFYKTIIVKILEHEREIFNFIKSNCMSSC